MNVLHQAVSWHEDLNLPVLPSLKLSGHREQGDASNEIKRYTGSNSKEWNIPHSNMRKPDNKH